MQQTPAEGSFAWFLAKGLDPYTGQPLKEGEKPRGPKRSSKRPEAKSAPKSGGKAKSAPHVVNYVPPKIGQGPGRVAGSIAINADAIGPAFRNAAESLKRAFGLSGNTGRAQPTSNAKALAQALRAALPPKPKAKPGVAARGLRAFAAHARDMANASD